MGVASFERLPANSEGEKFLERTYGQSIAQEIARRVSPTHIQGTSTTVSPRSLQKPEAYCALIP